jgi:hypothetical protein
MTTPPPSPPSWFVTRPPDQTYIASASERWEGGGSNWQSIPDATVSLQVGSLQAPSLGAFFIATFSAETLAMAPDDNNLVFLDIKFGDKPALPESDNHRFKSAAKSAEWSSHTTIRHIRFERSMTLQDVSASVHVQGGKSGTAKYGFQNWVLKIERYNI